MAISNIECPRNVNENKLKYSLKLIAFAMRHDLLLFPYRSAQISDSSIYLDN